MNYLSVENLSRWYGERVLFEGLSFGLSRGDKVALIANNGTGKSSLMHILASKDTPDTGTVTYREGVKVGFLAQEPELDNTLTIAALIQQANADVVAASREYEAALAAQTENYSEATQKAFDRASARMDELGAWDYERQLRQILTRFNITDHDQVVGNLSGGQRKRLALALVLLDKPELLVLDEPTNHLDIVMIEWLEKYLTQANITLLMVTHDRYFLDKVCNHILELSDGKLFHHKGNYAYFLEKRVEREASYDTEVGKAKKLMKKELEWMRRMPQARTTKSKARINAFYETESKATSRKVKQELRLQVKMNRIGGKILEMKKVYKAYGELPILQGFDYTFKRGERVGIIGPNGVGKSTFLNLITGRETADSGKINLGETIVLGYYAQQGLKFKPDQRVIDVLKEIAEVIVLGNGTKVSAAQFLEQFMFDRSMHYTPVVKLSGGERRRLHLLTVLMKNPNFLILDEPTNDLDLLTLNKLEEFLADFPGVLILVSHDRYFMDRLVDHLFIFQGEGKVKDYYGIYSEYRWASQQEAKSEKLREAPPAKETPKAAAPKTRLSYKEKLEYERLEGEIDALEEEKTDLEAVVQSGTSDYEALEKAAARLGEVVEAIDTKTLRWMELDEFAK